MASERGVEELLEAVRETVAMYRERHNTGEPARYLVADWELPLLMNASGATTREELNEAASRIVGPCEVMTMDEVV